MSLKKRLQRYQTTDFDQKESSLEGPITAITNDVVTLRGMSQETLLVKEPPLAKTTSVAQLSKQKRLQDEHEKKK